MFEGLFNVFHAGHELVPHPLVVFFAQFPFKESLYLSSELLRNPPQSRTNTCDLFGHLQAFTPVVVQRIGWIALSLWDCSQIWAICVFEFANVQHPVV